MYYDANIPGQPDPRVARTERRLCKLEEASDRAAELMNALADQARAAAKAPSPPPTARDLAEAFNRVCRNLRLIVALEARFDDYLAALVAGDPSAEFWPRRARQTAREAAPSKPERDRMEEREILRGNVLELIDLEILYGDDGQRIFREIDERLYESDRYDAFLDLPTEDAVEAICADLGVKPEWESFYDYDWPPWRTAKTRRPAAPPPDPGDPQASDLQREEALWPALETLAIPDDPLSATGAPPHRPPYGDTG
jgi:hypothetical protein